MSMEAFLNSHFWIFPALASGFFLYLLFTRFTSPKKNKLWRIVLWLTFSGSSGMVIWVGDNNLLFTLPVFFGLSMASTKGSRTGRLALISIFFCNIMSVCAMADTYLIYLKPDMLYDITTRLIRPVVWWVLWLILRKRVPEKCTFLSDKLWRLVLGLSLMPLCALSASVLLGYRYSDDPIAYSLTMTLGLIVIPAVFATSVMLMFTVAVLVEHERLKQLESLASMREIYYKSVQREEKQVRRLRHDMRNHLTALKGMLSDGNTEHAGRYLEELTGSPAMGTGIRICENETANAVLAAKKEYMERMGLHGDIKVSLPALIPVADTDLTALLGNALDNAIEAAEKADDKLIEVRCRIDKGLFMLMVKNGAEGINPGLSSSKPDKNSHGFGIPGMREIAERYGGSLEALLRKGRFELTVYFPVN